MEVPVGASATADMKHVGFLKPKDLGPCVTNELTWINRVVRSRPVYRGTAILLFDSDFEKRWWKRKMWREATTHATAYVAPTRTDA